MNKVGYLLVVLLLINLLIPGCYYERADGVKEDPNDGSVVISGWGPHMFSGLYYTDGEKADQVIASFWNAVVEEDNAALKQMFSSNAIAAADDLEGQISAFLNFCEGDLISCESKGLVISSSSDNAFRTKTFKASYDITTTVAVYRMAIKYCMLDTSDESNVGIHSLYIIQAENSDMQHSYWGDDRWEPGIVIEEAVRRESE